MPGQKFHTLKKEAYKIPVAICLFFIPLFFAAPFALPFTQGKELFFKTVALATLLVAAFIGIRKGTFSVRKIFTSPLAAVLAVTAGISIIADALSPTPLVAVYGTYSRGFGLIINLYLLAFAFWCANYLNEKDLRPLLRIGFIGGVITAAYAVLQKLHVDPFFGGYDSDIYVGRVFSFLGNPGYLGQYMILILAIGAYLSITAIGARNKIVYLAGILTAFVAMVLSGTRAAFLALAVCLVILAVKYRKEIGRAVAKKILKNKGARKMVIVGLLIMAMFAGIYAVLPGDRFAFTGTALRSVESRLEIWNGAFGLFLKRSVLGYGEESFYIYFPETITKKFLTLEEEINLSADRIHNEFLEKLFSQGILGAAFYLALIFFLLKIFFKTRSRMELLLALIPLANIVQNQFGFSDITISVLNYFCLGSLISLQIGKKPPAKFHAGRVGGVAVLLAALLFVSYFGYQTVYRPVMSQLAYMKSLNYRAADYSVAVNEHKKAIEYTPYYSQLWYELMFIDPSGMPRALSVLEKIEGESGSVLAWKGNLYKDSDPEKAADYYIRALEKNPYNPGWSRAFADMLFKNGDYENALFMYKQFLDAAPDFWKWSASLESMTPEEQKSYRVFFKNTPDFINTVARVEALETHLREKPGTDSIPGSGAEPQ